MQTVHKTLTAMAGTIRKFPVFSLLSSSENRALRWAEDCADKATTHDFSNLSDAQLRTLFSDDSDLATILAVASTAINRRIGAWRIFDATDVQERFAGLHRIADEVIAAARFSDSIKYFTEPDFPNTPIFVEMLGASLDAHRLAGPERAIVSGLVYAAEKRKSALPENICLTADFYSAITELDANSDLMFAPTRQQIISAALLTRGIIVEMDAGEGKTVSTALAALANAAAGSRVHVLTANDYLALRDAEWLAPVYESLGVSVAPVIGPMDEDERRSAYAQDIVYSTVRELGFDYLKDNLKLPPDRPIQSNPEIAIVDEADHVLIDQSRTPLIISGNEPVDTATIEKSHRIVRRLLELHSEEVIKAEQELSLESCSDADAEIAMLYAADPDNETLKRITVHRGGSRQRFLTDLADIEDTTSALDFENRYYFRVETQSKTVRLTERGETYIDANLGTANSERRWNAHSQAHQFLRAYTLFTRDVDYIVGDDGVVLVDPFNGRLLPDNRYLHGLQTALEAKEGLPPTPDAETLAQITIPGLMSRYVQVSGLTGTALEAQDDFLRDYGLPTVRVQPSEPSRRTDFPPTILNDTQAQCSAILAEVRHWHGLGRPVLIGTTSVEESEEISVLLTDHGVPHQLLNAVNSEREAQIVRDAGNFGAVTVATNMAGRGTDIILEPDLDQRILDAARTETSDHATPEETSMLGLFVIGVSLNASSRIDRQLRGRAGRQGALGASKLIVSAQDSPIAYSRQAHSIRASSARRVQKLVNSIQSESDADERWRSALSRDYASVLEAQTLSFYRWRRELLSSNAWDQSRSTSISRWAAGFTANEFESITTVGYESVFDNIQSSVWAEMGLDCDWMYGLGETELSDQLTRLISEQINVIRDQLGHESFDQQSRNVLAEQADELWPSHLNYLQDISLSCAIAGPTHRAAVGEFIEQSHGSFVNFLDNVNREAVPRLMELGAVESPTNHLEQPIVIDNEILSVLA